MEKHYNLTETAEILGVKVRTLREWIKDGSLNAFKYEGKKKWYVSQSEIEKMQKKSKENS
jgi:excisionase family DNA binding protein